MIRQVLFVFFRRFVVVGVVCLSHWVCTVIFAVATGFRHGFSVITPKALGFTMSERLSFRCNESRSEDVLASRDIVQIRRFFVELNPEHEGKAG